MKRLNLTPNQCGWIITGLFMGFMGFFFCLILVVDGGSTFADAWEWLRKNALFW